MLIKRNKWLVTGAAGFIGSHLVEALLKQEQEVIGFDNFSTGSKDHIAELSLLPGAAKRFQFIEGDIRSEVDVQRAFSLGPLDFVLHQAALGSVTRSIENPIATHENNVSGFLNVLWAACRASIRRFVYASSSSVYGDHPALPKVEGTEGAPLSPYALSKADNESYATLFQKVYGIPTVGLRYFNVFGPRQNFDGPYAAVIPHWIRSMLRSEQVYINGDGSTSRDFCFVENVVQANLRAALTENPEATGRAYNIAVGDRTTLLELFAMLKALLVEQTPELDATSAVHRDFRAGDVPHSLADISLARRLLGYEPTVRIGEGLRRSFAWYYQNLR